MAKRGAHDTKQVVHGLGEVVATATAVDAEPNPLLSNTVLPDEYDADPGEAPSAGTAEERTRDYLQGVREGSLRVIEFIESDFGDVGRVAAGEARKRWGLS
jgi:hypothetical protein